MKLNVGDFVEIINCIEASEHSGEKWEVQFLTQMKDCYRIENLKTGYRDTYHKRFLKKVKRSDNYAE